LFTSFSGSLVSRIPGAVQNNRPRKTLKFKTPKEIIERGVALTD
ncbi:hypothetical protein, partial [Escherichia coli]